MKIRNRRLTFVGMAFACLMILPLAGCSHSDSPQPAADAKAEAQAKREAKYKAAIDELPEAERAVAAAQRLCPVSNQPLGSMGMPFKVSVSDQAVYLCCEACKEDALAKPDETLAKLAKLKEPAAK